MDFRSIVLGRCFAQKHSYQELPKNRRFDETHRIGMSCILCMCYSSSFKLQGLLLELHDHDKHEEKNSLPLTCHLYQVWRGGIVRSKIVGNSDSI